MLNGGLIDWDGTIAMTPERQFKWFKYWSEENGKGLAFDTLKDFLDMYNPITNGRSGVQGVYDYLGLPCDMNDFNHPVWPAYKRFKSMNPVEMYPGIKDAIEKVYSMGRLNSDYSRNQALRLAINTTSDWKSIQPDMVRFGIINYFDSFCTAETLKQYDGSGNHGAINKPSKISVALMLNILGSDGETTFHLGDTLADLKASIDVRRHGGLRKENLITIGAAWGFEGRDALMKGVTLEDGLTAHFNYIIDHPDELPRVIEKYI
jgi:phosphoglycolate phosphatase-like HAD superfamily hydrolase